MQDLDFVPDWYRATLRRKNDLMVQVGAVVCLVLVMVFWTLDSAARIRSTRETLASLQASYDLQQVSWAELHELESVIQECHRKNELVSTIRGGVAADQLLSELSHLMPTATVLTEVTIAREQRVPLMDGQEMRSVPSSPSNRTGTIEIDGLAVGNTVVGEFHTGLVASPAFADVEMKYTRSMEFDGRKARRFRLECRLPRFE